MAWSLRSLLRDALTILGVLITFTAIVYAVEFLWQLTVPFVIPVGTALTALFFHSSGTGFEVWLHRKGRTSC